MSAGAWGISSSIAAMEKSCGVLSEKRAVGVCFRMGARVGLCSPFTWPISRLLLDMLRLRKAGCDRDSIMSSERRDQRRTEYKRRSRRVPARKSAILYS